jgi:hypothetical protein
MGMHVNPANIDKTIEAIKSSRRFDMGDWKYCAKAHAIKVMGAPYRNFPTEDVLTGEVAAFWGCDLGQADWLFHEGHLSRSRVIDVLRNLRDTGSMVAPVQRRELPVPA